MTNTKPKRHIIIGTSAAGISNAVTLRQLDPEIEIICITDQEESPYNKCRLVDYLAGIKPYETLATLTPESALEKNITILYTTRVVKIDAQKSCITVVNKKTNENIPSLTIISYTTLFLGTGTEALIPPIPFLHHDKKTSSIELLDHPAIFTFHTLNDTATIKAFVEQKKPKNSIVIGAGLSGLEAADALALHGVAVTVIEKGPRVLSKQITAGGSAIIEQAMATKGVKFYPNEQVNDIQETAADRHRFTLNLASGTTLTTDMIIIAIGGKPHIELPKQAGIALQGNHILVDDTMRTSLPNIYAGGDAIMVKDLMTGTLVPSCTWPDAMLQGLVAAHALASKEKRYPGAAIITSSSFFGTKFVATAQPYFPEPSVLSPEHAIIIRSGPDFHHTFWLKNDLLKGYCLVGTTQAAGMLKKAMMTGQPINIDQL